MPVTEGSVKSTPTAVAGLERTRAIAYWVFTLPLVSENAAGAMWVFLPLIPGVNHSHPSLVFTEYLHLMLAHLGYPQYFKYILGPWQLACAVVLVAPRFPRAKEWAYIGAFFNYSSAFVSELFVGDRPNIGAAIFAIFTIVSWALRPRDRRFVDSTIAGEVGTLSWASAAGILLFFVLLSLFVLPKLPNP
jgi:DoxX-like family